MRVEASAGTLHEGRYVDRFFHDEMPSIELDFENDFVADLFRRHRTFPAFLPGIGACPGYTTCEYQVPTDCDWVAVSPFLAMPRSEFQGILDQVREEEDVGRRFEDIPFSNSLDDVVYWLNYAITLDAPSCVIGWSVIEVPDDLVTLASIPPDQCIRRGSLHP